MTIIQALDNTSIGGKTVQMNLARGNQGKKEDAKEGCKLFVHGVKQETKEEALKVNFVKNNWSSQGAPPRYTSTNFR